MTRNDFPVGSKVIVMESFDQSETYICKGRTGTVLPYAGAYISTGLPVQWDHFNFAFHNCRGYGTRGYCYNISEYNLDYLAPEDSSLVTIWRELNDR